MQQFDYFAFFNKRIPFFIIFFLCLLFVFVLCLHPISGDGDFFHHLNTGKYIIENKQLPFHDSWTYSAQGKPWIANAWGTGVIYYLLYSSFGPNAISIYIALQAILLFILLFFLLNSYGTRKYLNLLSLLFGFSIIATRWPNRPELTTYPFVVGILLVYRLKAKYPHLIILLPLLLFLWSVLYAGSVFVGILLIITIILLQLYRDKFNIKKSELLFYICALLSLPVVFLNGTGAQSILYFSLIPTMASIQGEWVGIFSILGRAIPSELIHLQYEILLYFIYFIFVLFIISLKFNIARKHPLELLLTLSLILPFFVIRNIPLAVVLSLPMVGILLESFHRKNKFLIITTLVPLFCVVISWNLDVHGLGEDKKTFPPGVIEFIKQNHVQGNMFTNQQSGSYISYHLFPDVLVYSDTRDDLFINSSVLTEMQEIVSQKKDITPLVTKSKANLVLVDAPEGNSYKQLFYNKDWALVYVDDRYLLFVKREIAVAKKLFEYKSIDPYNKGAAKSGLEKQAIEEYKKILSMNDSFNHAYNLASVYFDQKDYDLTIDIAEKMAVPNTFSRPLYSSKKNYLLATSYLMKQNCVKTKKYNDEYHADLTNKFIFNWTMRLRGIDEKIYMIYYLQCERNIVEAQTHLENYIKDDQIETAEKQNALRLFNTLRGNSFGI